jgi:predicted PurR-regulated permease PerM
MAAAASSILMPATPRTDGDEGRDRDRDRDRFVRRTLIALGLTAAFVAGIALSAYAPRLLALAFAGVLLAVFLRALGGYLSAWTGLPKGWASLLVGLVILGAAALGAWSFSDNLSAQIDAVAGRIPSALRRVEGWLSGSAWGRAVLDNVPPPDRLPEALAGAGSDWAGGLAAGLAGIAASLAAGLGEAALVVFLGLYLAVEPEPYLRGLERLLPIPRRARFREVVAEIGDKLNDWLLGQAVQMALVGTVTGVGLWMLGLPGALPLGIAAGLLDFVPYLGPVAAFIPAALVAVGEGPSMVGAVLVLYLAVQMVESYLIAPLVQRSSVSLPPALTILAQVLAGFAAGLPGVLVATPLAAAAMVVVRMLYIEDVLGDRGDGSDRDGAGGRDGSPQAAGS